MISTEERIKAYNTYAKYRDKKKITDYQMSKVLGIGTAMFTHWKQGKYIPKYDKLKVIADTLGISVDNILGVKA